MCPVLRREQLFPANLNYFLLKNSWWFDSHVHCATTPAGQGRRLSAGQSRCASAPASSPNFTISQMAWLFPRVLKVLLEVAHVRRRCRACKHFILNALHLKLDYYSCSVSWIWFDIFFFQVLFRFPSCGVLSGGVMVALTEHPVVDVVLVVEDTSLGSTNIQVEKAWVQP